MTKPKLPIAIFYEHQEWFRPLFDELDRRGTPYKRLDARSHSYDPASTESGFSLLFNRMSSSAYTRGNGHAIYYAANYIAHLERIDTPVVNGSRSFAIETSKSSQLSLLASLGLAFPRTIVINSADEATAAAARLGYPVIVKPNIGGAGSGILRYDARAELEHAVETGTFDLGFQRMALVQEYVPPRGGHITRVETLDGQFLYAIKVFTSGDSFNLCPADACQTPVADSPPIAAEAAALEAVGQRSGAGSMPASIQPAPTAGPSPSAEIAGAACPVEAVRRGFRVEACSPPDDAIQSVIAIAQAADMDVGGVEYIIDDRDGRMLFYDINVLSNFVADAPRIVGFDPHERLVDYLERRAF
jgi:glutathione synthase/RimK-type ligase-like ATP-grasp enzyme